MEIPLSVEQDSQIVTATKKQMRFFHLFVFLSLFISSHSSLSHGPSSSSSPSSSTSSSSSSSSQSSWTRRSIPSSLLKYYHILGAVETDDLTTIKSKYRHLALKYHPDKTNNSPESSQKMQEINEAYDQITLFLQHGDKISSELLKILDVLYGWWANITQEKRQEFQILVTSYLNSDAFRNDLGLFFHELSFNETFRLALGVFYLLVLVLFILFMFSLIGMLFTTYLGFKFFFFILRSCLSIGSYLFRILFSPPSPPNPPTSSNKRQKIQ